MWGNYPEVGGATVCPGSNYLGGGGEQLSGGSNYTGGGGGGGGGELSKNQKNITVSHLHMQCAHTLISFIFYFCVTLQRNENISSAFSMHVMSMDDDIHRLLYTQTFNSFLL